MIPELTCMDVAFEFWRRNKERSNIELTNEDIMRLCFLANLFYSNKHNIPIASNMSFENIYEAPFNEQINDMLCYSNLEEDANLYAPEYIPDSKDKMIDSIYNIFAHMKTEDYENLKSYILY